MESVYLERGDETVLRERLIPFKAF